MVIWVYTKILLELVFNSSIVCVCWFLSELNMEYVIASLNIMIYRY